MEHKTGSPWPSHGQGNRNQGPRDPGIYGRLGADHLGRKTYNSYMEAEAGRSLTRPSFPVFGGDWKTFEKSCLAEAHAAGVNEAITVARKSYNKNWDWPFATDPRWEPLISSDYEAENSETETESSEMKTRAKTKQEITQPASKWERFSVAFAEAAHYQSQRLYRYLDRALDGVHGINLQSQFASVPEDDGIGAWIALLRWNTRMTDPVRERELVTEQYYSIQLKPREHPEALWTRIRTALKKLHKINHNVYTLWIRCRFCFCAVSCQRAEPPHQLWHD